MEIHAEFFHISANNFPDINQGIDKDNPEDQGAGDQAMSALVMKLKITCL